MPSGYASSMSAAICSESRVLPRPPIPSVRGRLPFEELGRLLELALAP
jgi:hypothetical protein